MNLSVTLSLKLAFLFVSACNLLVMPKVFMKDRTLTGCISDFDGIKVRTVLKFNKVDIQLEGGESAQSELTGPMVRTDCI